jgi:hypothetical protein
MLPIGLQHKWYSGGRQKVLSAIVRDANRQALAYVYFEEEPRRPSGDQSAHPRRGPAHRRQHRQAAGDDTSAPCTGIEIS